MTDPILANLARLPRQDQYTLARLASMERPGYAMESRPAGLADWMDPDKIALQQPWLDPIELLAGVGGAARVVGRKALAGLVPDILGGVAAESVADRESTWAPLAANVGANLLAGKMLDPANLAEIRRIAPKALANERGMFTPPTGEDLQRLARMAAGEDVDVPRVFSALHDRMPRVEIDDSGLDFSGVINPHTGKMQRIPFKSTVSDVLPHPDVYSSVDVGSIPVTLQQGAGGIVSSGSRGSFTGDKINVFQSEPGDGSDTLLHELQHAVQERAGFARGGSPESVKYNMDPMPKINRVAVESELERMISRGENPLKIANKRLELDELKAIEEDALKRASMENYLRLAGEIEARDTASRMNLSEMARARTQPYSGYAVRPDGSFGPTYEPNPIRLEDFIVRR